MTTISNRRMPRVQDDPAALRVHEARTAYEADIDRIRADLRFSDAEKARQLVNATAKVNDVIGREHQDLTQRRSSRYNELVGLLPIGPGIPDGTSPADAAVLRQAWRGAYADAQNQDRDGLQASLREAQRFGDDIAVRAIVTAANDQGLTDVIDSWAETAGVQAEITEMMGLQETANGATVEGLIELQAFAPVPDPKEQQTLPQHEVIEAQQL